MIEGIKKELEGVTDDKKITEIVNSIPEGEERTLKFKHKGKTLSVNYKQGTAVSMKYLHGIDIVEELKQIVIYEDEQKRKK